MTKTESEFRHAVMRAEQRYPMLGPPDRLVRSVRRLIAGGDSLCVHRASQRKTHHVVVIDGVVVLAVYDKSRHQVVTLLPSHNVWDHAYDTEKCIALTQLTDGAKWV